MNLEPTTREGKKAKVREDIINAAVFLFEEQGYGQTAVDMIAAAAGVSTRTFFRYFKTKDLVVFPFHSEYVSTFIRQLRNGLKSRTPFQTVRHGFRIMAELYQQSWKDHLRYQQIISSSPDTLARSVHFDAVWENAVADVWKYERTLSDEQIHRANLVAGMIMGAIKVVMEKWYASDCRESLTDMGETALDFVEKGIGEDHLIFDEAVGKPEKRSAS